MRVHLVDGTFELFRCFHGAPRATSPGGAEVGAVRGLLQTLAALLRGPDVTHVAVAVDQAMAIPVRAGEDSSLTSQHGRAAEAIRALGLVIWPMLKRYQADDALATAAARFKDAPGVEQVVICTPDKDLAQCVSGTHVVLLDRIRGRTTDEAGVLERYGVAPGSIPDFLALAGDAVDGLPGLPGFGPKSAGALLRRFGRIEEIPLDASAWDVALRGKDRLARTFRERKKEALLYRELTTLALDVPLQESLEDLEWRGADRSVLEPFVDELGDRSVLERVPRWRA
jgi:5'-3' exonuclease